MKLRKIKIHHINGSVGGGIYWIDSSWDIKNYPTKWFLAYGREGEAPDIKQAFMFNSSLIEAIEWTDIYHDPS